MTVVSSAAAIRLTAATDVTPLPFDFLWVPHIAVGKVTVILDRTRSKTSLLTAYLAATASGGGSFPACLQSRAPTRAIVLAGRHAIRNSIRSQLDVFDANLDYVKFLQRHKGRLDLRALLALVLGNHLRYAVAGSCAELITIEISAKDVEATSTDAARLFSRLERDARALEAAIVVVLVGCSNRPTHQVVKAIQGLSGVAAVCLVERDPTVARFLFKPEKTITGHIVPALSFRVVHTSTSYDMPAARIIWDDLPIDPAVAGSRDVTGMTMAGGASAKPDCDCLGLGDGKSASAASPAKRVRGRLPRKNSTKLKTAVTFLTDALANGPMLSGKLKQMAEDAAVRPITLRRAAEKLRLIKKHRRWSLREPPAEQ